MFLMIWYGVPYLTYASYAAYVLMSRGKRRKIVIVSSLQKSDEPTFILNPLTCQQVC